MPFSELDWQVMSDSELLNPANFDATAIFCIAALVLLLVAVWFLVVGYSMKFSLSIVGAGRFGFWKSLLIVLLACGASSIVSTTLMMAVPGDPFMALLAVVGSMGVNCLVISMIAQCSFGKGFLAYLLNGFFNLLGAIPVAILLVVGLLGVRRMVDPDGVKMEQWKREMAQVQASGAGTGLDGFDVTAVANGMPEGSQRANAGAGSQGLPKQLPSVVDQPASTGGWFGWGAKGSAKPYPQFDSGGECRSGCAKNRATPSTPAAPAASPSAPQANPFAQ